MKSKLRLLLTVFLSLIIQNAFAQEKVVTGVVKDVNGLTLPGVNVVVKQTKTSAQTDLDGKYSIKASEGNTIEFSFIGNKNSNITVGKSNSYNIVMQSNVELMDEVVVVGYGTQKKKEVTSSVSKIKGSDIQGLITPSFESQLAGRASGVQVTTSTGIVGAAPRVRIRGVASINSGTQPLYIVDGIPMYSGDLGGYADANALGDINPNDIESFEVLKDGAAAAIYGSRAANGVIIITTKKGKKGTMKVDYSSTSGFASPFKTFDLLKTADFLTISNEKRTNAGQAPWAAGSDFDTDWQRAVLNRSAFQMDHSLSFNGGNEKTKYFMSMGYSTQEGIAVSNEMTRYTFRSSLDHQIAKWLTIGANIGLTRTEYEGLNTGRNSLSGNMFNAIRQLPNTPIFDSTNPTGYNINLSTGNVGQGTNLQPVGDNISNIAYVLNFNKFKSKINRTIISAFASVDIAKGLNYRFQASADNAITGGFLYWNPVHGDGRGSNGRLQNNNTDLMRWNTQNILNYNKTLFDNHNISATAVVEYQKERNESFFGVGTNLLDEFYNQNLVTGSYGTQESGGGITEVGIMSYVGRLSYNYKQKYFLQGSLRRDGLSKLAPETRWTTFTGYSGGWNIAKENFMSSLNKYISEFKVRGSYAEIGNTEIGTYPYLGLTSASQYGTLNGIAFTQFGNDQLQWETSKKFDFGVDMALFNNKVKLTFDYFKNDTDGLILNSPVPPSLGVPNNSISKNIGSMLNDGYEFGLDVSIINNQNFKWDVNANLTLQSNEVTSTPNGVDLIGGSSTDVNIAPNIIIRQGESLNSLYGFQYWGVNPANGFPVYYKANGTLVQGNPASQSYSVFDPNNPSNTSTSATLTQADKKILGNTIPKYFGGFSSRMSYKNVDLSFLIRFSGGNKIFNSTRRELMNMNLNNNGTEILGRWQSPSNPGDGWTPILYANSNTFLNQSSNATTRFVEDGDFISFDNITLGYNFPKKLMEKIKVENIRLFVQGQNLFMITDYKGLNPEMETAGVDINGTPRGKIFSMGINVKL
ncbi:TonB-dependent receptor [Flavobacterium sp.]|uniref:SusC/RagA family TonB-linked outer membrane protein n=1 Tax=Flavobacterium sp. TaxID=239 RepID=UPI002617343B|nr:TonB-dependent receptor [Flavobacterium sp.]